LVEIVNLTLGTSNQLILKLDTSNQGFAFELIGIGSLGSGNKLAGVRCWHRSPAFKHVEWFDLRMHCPDNVLWLEIGDGARLAKIINSFKDLSGMMAHDPEFEFCEDVHVVISDSEMQMRHEKSSSTFTLGIRKFDTEWASALIVVPSTSAPRCSVKVIAGIDQLSAILRKIDKWREEWSVDLLTISTVKAERTEDNWDLIFAAESSTPPRVKLSVALPKCPTGHSARSSEPCKVSLSLSGALKALIVPLEQCRALNGSLCNVNWMVLGMGQISTTIFLPNRIKS
jgi:hypothetical protein